MLATKVALFYVRKAPKRGVIPVEIVFMAYVSYTTVYVNTFLTTTTDKEP